MRGRDVPPGNQEEQGYSQYRRVNEYWFEEHNDQIWEESYLQPIKPYITLESAPAEGAEGLGDHQEFAIPYDEIDDVIEVLLHAKQHHPMPQAHWKKVNDTWELTAAGRASGETGIIE